MFKGKCLKCGWVGNSTDTLKQWFDNVEFDYSELLLICPVCKIGVVKEVKPRHKKGEAHSSPA